MVQPVNTPAPKKVLWISRHEMTDAQLRDLERVVGGAVRVTPWRETVRDVRVLEPQIREADAVAAVLPPDLLRQLLEAAGSTPVLRAVSSRRASGRIRTLPDGRQEQEFDFVHLYWEQVLRVEIVTRRL